MNAISVALLSLMLGVAYAGPNSTVEDESRLRKALFNNYDPEVMPGGLKYPVNVSVGISPIAIRDIDVATQTLNFEGWVLLSWNDFRLMWDPEQYGGLKNLRVLTRRIWIPDVTLYNSGNNGAVEYVEGSKTQTTVLSSNGQIIWVPATSIRVLCDLDMSLFPYDTHRCSLVFGSWVYDGYRLDLSLDGKTPTIGTVDLSNLRNHSEWRVVSTSVERQVKFYECCEEPYPSLTFNMTLRRQSPVYQAAVLSPIAAGLILALLTFLISPSSNQRLFLGAFNVLLFLVTLFHLQTKLPSVGTQTPYIVLLCEGMVILSTLSMVWSSMVRSISGRTRYAQPPQLINRFLDSWATKAVLISDNKTMKDNCEKNCNVKDPEMIGIIEQDKSSFADGGGWAKLFVFLDRLAFIAFLLFILIATFTFFY